MKMNFVYLMVFILFLLNVHAETHNGDTVSSISVIHNKDIFYGVDLRKRTFNPEGFSIIEDKSPHLMVYSRSFDGWKMTVRVPNGKLQSVRLFKFLPISDTKEDAYKLHEALVSKNEAIYGVKSECSDNKHSLPGRGCVIMDGKILIDTGVIQQEDGRWSLVNGATYIGR